MAISKVDTCNIDDFSILSGSPIFGEDEIRMTQGDSVVGPVYQLKNTGGRFKIRVSLDSLSGIVISVQGRMGPADDFHSISVIGSGGRLTVSPENVMPEMRIVLTKNVAGTTTYTQTGAFCFGEV